MKLEYDELFSNFAFNCNLRHYTSDNSTTFTFLNGQEVVIDLTQAGTTQVGDVGLVDITASNTVDKYTQSTVDAAARVRFHDDGFVEILRTTFYIGDRARYFYIAGANCDSDCLTDNCDGPMDIEYKITFTNGYDWQNKHFSADEIGVMVGRCRLTPGFHS